VGFLFYEKIYLCRCPKFFLIPGCYDVTIDMSIKFQTRCRRVEHFGLKKKATLFLYMVFVTFDVETLSTIDSTNNIRNFRIVDLIWFINGQGRTVPTAKFIDFNYK